jgi:NAD(P)-dependent dehydrogenase (short-subunit alcohol dehydrogenase family)
MTDKFLQGKVAIVTGASRGIGRAIALALGRAGARLALAGRAQDKLTETQRLARELGAEAETFICDVRDET